MTMIITSCFFISGVSSMNQQKRYFYRTKLFIFPQRQLKCSYPILKTVEINGNSIRFYGFQYTNDRYLDSSTPIDDINIYSLINLTTMNIP